ncbi:MAG: AMP-binding protein, partial [Campylobacter sp.]|nr:AMP-binding protein [Campylobacter sp.]
FIRVFGLIFVLYVAGAMSKFHIELGIVPVGAFGIFASIFFFGSSSSILIITICSFAFGFFGGLFIVPLNATIQYFAPEISAGKIMAGNNFLQNVAMVSFLLLSIVFVYIGIPMSGLFVISSLVCLVGSFYAIFQLPHLFTRLILMPILKSNYNFNVDGLQNLPQSGGVLLLGNHISWIDWLVLQVASPRGIKFVMYRGIYNKWYLTWVLKFFKVIPIGAGASKESIELMRKHLQNGEVVALFPEGHISYNGQINEFQKGFELVIKDLSDIAVVPFYLRGLWGSSFSRASEYYKELTKKRGKREIIVAFGKPIYGFIDAVAMKQKVIELSFSSWRNFISKQAPLTHHWLDSAKSNLFKECARDSFNVNLNNLKFITAVLVFAKIMREVFKKQERIGVLLPSSSIGAIINMALLAIGKIPININYTLSEKTMEAALRKAEISSVITSEKFLDKLSSKGFDFKNLLTHKAVFAEDLAKRVSKFSRFRSLLTAFFAPARLIRAMYFEERGLQDTATILFSSGSEGEPKGIELTHENLLTNIKQISELLNFRKDDVILNSLPIFHSFGLTVTTLLPLVEGVKMVSAPDPTDGAEIGKMAARNGATILFGTSTFFRLYAKNKKLHPLMFQSVRMVIAGAEKLKNEVKDAFKMKFGLEIYEGYGATETAPVVSVNMPNILEKESLKELVFSKIGSVGMPLPGTIVKIVAPDTLEELKTGEDGLIIIGGGQVMKGYLNDEAKTAEVIAEIDGVRYYKTGDKGHMDEQGFVVIIDRYSRFAKIGGEMISLGSVEEEIAKVFGEEAAFTAVNVPDEKKGESVALLVKSELGLDELSAKLKGSNLAPIMMPSLLFAVDEIPMLASGKVDFKGAKALALNLMQGGVNDDN